MRKAVLILAVALLMVGALAVPALAAYDGVVQNVEKNGAFQIAYPGAKHVTNGHVNLALTGAMRAFAGNATHNANLNSAVDTYDTLEGTRVEPPGLFE